MFNTLRRNDTLFGSYVLSNCEQTPVIHLVILSKTLSSFRESFFANINWKSVDKRLQLCERAWGEAVRG